MINMREEALEHARETNQNFIFYVDADNLLLQKDGNFSFGVELQLKPAMTDVKGLTNFVHYRRISHFANIETIAALYTISAFTSGF